MFKFLLKKKNIAPVGEVVPPGAEASVKVYTIPTKFYNVIGSQATSRPFKSAVGGFETSWFVGKKKNLLIIAGIFVLLLISVGVVVFTTPELFNSVPSDTPINNQQSNSEVVANSATNVNTKVMVSEELNSNQEKTPEILLTNSEEAIDNNLNGSGNEVSFTPEEDQPVVAVNDSLDSDQDGLTDLEEVLYGTDKLRPDSDADGYLDGNEVRSGYTPAEPKKKIKDTNLVKFYQNSQFQYSILYPAGWIVKPLDASNKEVIFNATTGEFVGVSVTENPQSLTAEKWLQENVDSNFNFVTAAKTKNGTLMGVKSDAGYNVYYFVAASVYTVTYNFGVRSDLNFRSTFEMMSNSFFVESGLTAN